MWKQVFDQIDTDNSGEVDIDEFIKWWRTYEEPKNQAQVRSQIASKQELDANEDAYLDDDEPTVEEPEDQWENPEYDDENWGDSSYEWNSDYHV